ncbi:septum site-determining protein MinC [Parasporobacterium paucivorans]|uniref:Probable septum site-determining protein MinC n=1 Tax=Parasporobacterium paucivorans DSM 15970 TaxID=1122934 RepID=A0A1M6A2V2_9FIRM|nr:septum site-determining protein MinC [Parasporobacterium paucivorans]SHI30786.1 septum site-determining protein MinC [Parasporobacterium paucivorans DSM 15970]
MKNSVMIKGNKYGIVLVLDAIQPFDDLKLQIAEKFGEASKFFGKCSLALSFEGRQLSDTEEQEVVDIISENSDISIICIADSNKSRETMFKKSVDEKLGQISSNLGEFYKGTLRSGQALESDNSLVILGDVNPGARVASGGSVVVLGALKGTVYAGVSGNMNSFVVALEMNPLQIKIGDVIARRPDNSGDKSDGNAQVKIAFLEGGDIYIEPLSKEVLSEIRF